MKTIIVYVAVVLLISTHGKAAQERIVGGLPASQSEFPFIASLRSDTSPVCAGIIVNARWVVSAAHCDLYGLITKVGVGNVALNQQTIYQVENVIPHPNYNKDLNFNDIMMVKTTKNIALKNGVVSIAQVNSNPASDSQVQNMRFAGWGATTANGVQYPVALQVMNYTLQSPSTCYYNSIQTNPRNTLYSSEIQLCAVGVTSGSGGCYGDDGGPLVSNGMVYGIGSSLMAGTCVSGYPDIFVRTSYYYNWAVNIINNN